MGKWDRIMSDKKDWDSFFAEASTEALQGLKDLKGTIKPDMVNRPPHYNFGEIETIDYIIDVLDEGGALDYCQGNVIKYTGTRMFTKGDPVENAKKAIWYLNKMIELLEKNKETS
jgi:hypothetical protein